MYRKLLQNFLGHHVHSFQDISASFPPRTLNKQLLGDISTGD